MSKFYRLVIPLVSAEKSQLYLELLHGEGLTVRLEPVDENGRRIKLVSAPVLPAPMPQPEEAHYLPLRRSAYAPRHIYAPHPDGLEFEGVSIRRLVNFARKLGKPFRSDDTSVPEGAGVNACSISPLLTRCYRKGYLFVVGREGRHYLYSATPPPVGETLP